jgi:hypothetical protein
LNRTDTVPDRDELRAILAFLSARLTDRQDRIVETPGLNADFASAGLHLTAVEAMSEILALWQVLDELRATSDEALSAPAYRRALALTRLLAAPYRRHSDYQAHWQPGYWPPPAEPDTPTSQPTSQPTTASPAPADRLDGCTCPVGPQTPRAWGHWHSCAAYQPRPTTAPGT